VNKDSAEGKGLENDISVILKADHKKIRIRKNRVMKKEGKR
jgi:hypothetical protein